jgi:TP901 family phage tail tape measure protein
MANDKNLIIKIDAKTSGFSKGLAKARSETEKLQKQLSSITKKAAIGFTAITASIGATAFAFGRFQKDFTQVATLLDKTSFSTKTLEQGTADLRKGILSLRAASGESFTDLNKGLFDLISAGIPAEEAIKSLATATNLAAAGGTDVATAVDAITTSISAFGLEASDAERVSQLFFLAQKNGKTTVAELANSMGVVATSADAFGVSLEEVLAATAAVTLAGKSTSQSMAGLNQVFLNVAKPTADAAEEAKRLGVSFDSTSLRAKGLEGFLKDIVAAEGFTSTSIEKLFSGAEALTVALALTGKQSESFASTLKQLSDEAALAKTFNDALTKANEIQTKSWNKMIGALSSVVVLIGAELSPLIIAIANKVSAFAKVILEADSGIIKIIKNFLVFAAGITGLTALIGGLGLAVLALRAGLKALGIQALLTNKSFLAFGAGLFKVTGITRAFTAASALTTTALKAMGIAGAGAWKKILLPITGAIAAYVGFNAVIKKTGEFFGISAETSEKSLKRVKDKITGLKDEEQKLQDKVKNGFEFRKEANAIKLADVQKEIAASEALQAVIQKEVELRSQTGSASASLPLAAEGPEAPEDAGGPDLQAETEAVISEKARLTDLKIAEAEREREALKAIRDGSSEEEVQALRDKNALISELDQLKLEKELLNEEEKSITKGSKREAEIEKELELNTLQQEALQEHLDVLEEIKVEDDERKTEREDLFNELNDEKKIERDAAEIEALKKNLMTKDQLKIANAKAEAGRINRDRALFLKDEKKFGTNIAKMKKLFRSEEFKGTQQALGNLSSLRNSKSKSAQKAGKAAAIAQATISTFEGATKAFTSLAGIPIIGPVLGTVAAAAAVAAGLTQIQNIKSTPISGAVAGGLVKGGITGKDTEPFMLAKGEAVTPADVTPALMNTFKELRNLRDNGGLLNAITQDSNLQPNIRTNTVINESETIRSSIDTVREELEPQQVNIDINIEEDAVDFITAQQRENEALSIGTI